MSIKNYEDAARLPAIFSSFPLSGPPKSTPRACYWGPSETLPSASQEPGVQRFQLNENQIGMSSYLTR